MAKLIGKIKLNTAIFISGRGSNLNNLIKFSKKKNSSININLVISSEKKAKGVIYARKNNIKINIINFNNRLSSEKKISKILTKKKIVLEN